MSFPVRAPFCLDMPLALMLLVASGCHAPEANLAGTWKSGEGMMLHMYADHKWSIDMPNDTTFEGSWMLDGQDVILQTRRAAGLPVEQAKEKLMKAAIRKNSAKVKSLAERIDKPSILLLSGDGKSMSTDKAKDPKSGDPETYHKQD
jgi:hypothetical protein